MPKTFKNIERSSLGKYSTGVPVSFYDLDAMTQGLHRGSLIVIAGHTFEHPIRGLNEHTIVQNFGSFTPSASNLDKIGDATSKAIKLMREYGWL